MNRDVRKAKLRNIDVYPVTCEQLSSGRTNIEVLESVVKGGAKIIQLREKEYSSKDLYETGIKFREITAKAEMLLIINDRLDVALAVEADGVHLGQDDLPITAARKLAPDLLVGISTHSLEEALVAEKQGADYINIGPIFPTKTKAGIENFLGPDTIEEISRNIKIPFTVMGGINESNIDEVLAKGATKVAVVTAITKASDIIGAVKNLRKKILAYRK